LSYAPESLAEDTGLEPVCAFARQFSKLLPHRFVLPSVKKKMRCEVWQSHFAALDEKLAGAFRFELKTSVLETDILPIETTRL
jgi:hypothetical protein